MRGQYSVGDMLTVNSHKPPPPLSKAEYQKRMRAERWEEDELTSPIQLCLRSRPLPGLDGPEPVDITLTEELHVGRYITAQVYVAMIVKSSESLELPMKKSSSKYTIRSIMTSARPRLLE